MKKSTILAVILGLACAMGASVGSAHNTKIKAYWAASGMFWSAASRATTLGQITRSPSTLAIVS